MCEVSSFSTTSPTACIINLLEFCQSNRWKLVSVALICTSLVSEFDDLLNLNLKIYYYYLLKYSWFEYYIDNLFFFFTFESHLYFCSLKYLCIFLFGVIDSLLGTLSVLGRFDLCLWYELQASFPTVCHVSFGFPHGIFYCGFFCHCFNLKFFLEIILNFKLQR